ncbi:hypothetical protein [Hymenobacter antarcticus]|uniref:Uncharacterized protein n=1 Tax=Hymenobacter antarcticus TaxID=486270 RepID=A0ABP7R5Z5_9BACT
MQVHHPVISPDFVITSATGEEQLLVEVKTWMPTPAQAQELRQNYGHPACYFLLATPDHMALWLPTQGEQPLVASAYSVDASLVLANYLTLERHPLQALDGQVFSLVVSSWLGSVMFKPARTLLDMPAQAWLVESGVHERIYRGYIHRERQLAK